MPISQDLVFRFRHPNAARTGIMPSMSIQTEQSQPMERTLTPTWLRQRNAQQAGAPSSPSSSEDTYVEHDASLSPKGVQNSSMESLASSVSSLGSIHNITARGIATPTGRRRGHGTPVSLRFDNITVVAAPPGALPAARPKMVDVGTQTDAQPPAPVPALNPAPTTLWGRFKKRFGPGSKFWSICSFAALFVLDRIAIGVKVF